MMSPPPRYMDVDQTESWAAAGLAVEFGAVYEEALPVVLLEEVLKAIPHLKPAITKTSSGSTSEHSWWMPLFDASGALATPRSAIEEAVLHLHSLALGGGGANPIVGGEWWIRDQKRSAHMEFHYDSTAAGSNPPQQLLSRCRRPRCVPVCRPAEDESTYRIDHLIRSPELSTVTYLSDGGSPTLVLNQTLGDGAGAMNPLVAAAGLLMRPRRNQHLVFRGVLNHGVVSQLAAPGEGSLRRRALLINWWRAPVPTGEICLHPDAAHWRGLGLLRSDAKAAATAGATAAAQPPPSRATPAPALALRVAPADAAEWVSFEVGDGFIYQYGFPAPAQLPSGAGALAVAWRGAAAGPLVALDRRNYRAVMADERPKLLLAVAGKARLWAGALPPWLPAVHQAYGASRTVANVLLWARPRPMPGALEVLGRRRPDLG